MVDAQKVERIVEAARHLFYTRGVYATRMEDIAAAAGVSKVTVYNRFGDKTALLTACVSAECDRMQAVLDRDDAAGLGLVERLEAVGRTLLTFLLSPGHTDFERVMASEGVRNPAFAAAFYAAGPARMLARLAGLLAEGHSAGVLEVPSPQLAAEHLFGMWRGMADTALRFQQRPPADADAIDARVRDGTNRFLRAYAREPTRSSDP